MSMTRLAAMAATLLFVAGATAQPAGFMPELTPAEAPVETGAMPLYPQGAPTIEGASSAEQWGQFMESLVVRNVTKPTLTPVLPSADKATGAAVIVAPGGAFMMLAMDHEGHKVARWLADRGIAAFVLKYRLEPTPADPVQFMKTLGARMTSVRADAPPVFQPAIDDGLTALRLVRERAAEWNIDPKRVGMMGFSAGAMTTLQTTLTSETGERPAFIGLIYGPMNAVEVPADAPPLFAAIASDDPIFPAAETGLIRAWLGAERPTEFHLYQSGGHGFGIVDNGTSTSLWPKQFLAWLQTNGMLETK